MRHIILFYGLAAYALFIATFAYLLGFLANFGVPKSIDSGHTEALLLSFVTNLCLVALFGLQHSIMARPAFKRKWTRIIPTAAERSTYVVATCVCLILLYIFWQPMPLMLFCLKDPNHRIATWIVFGMGWSILFLASFMIDHFELFGLRQVYCHYTQYELPNLQFQTKGLYRYIRHPIMTGFLIAIWATPDMTLGHLSFAGLMTLYIVIGVYHEERDLRENLGDVYETYSREVPSVCPMPGRRAGRTATRRSLDSFN